MVVVAAYAPSSQGDAALRAAIREVFLTSRELVVASYGVLDPLDGQRCATAAEVREAIARVLASMSHNERAYLETLDVKVVESASSEIDDFLIDVANKQKAELIVIALRHAGPQSKLSLGHSVKRLIQGSPCPVLVAKDF